MKFNSINYLSKTYYENITGMVQRSSNNTLLFLTEPHTMTRPQSLLKSIYL